MTETQALKRRLKEASAAIAAARQTLANGDLVDLGGLETEVDEICGGLTKVPAQEAQNLKSALISLANDLDLLSKDLNETHEKLAGEIEGVQARQRATKAYGRGKGK
jgi:hypothetical protein